jgi:hypothetical protein
VLYVLITGSPNVPLIAFGKSLATYTYQIVLYLTFNSDVRPFPFDADWPYETTDESQENDAGENMD